MRRSLYLLAVGLVAVGAVLGADAGRTRRREAVAATPVRPADPAPTAAPADAFETFRGIADRNIFNAARTGKTRATDDQGPATDSLSLVGTLESDKGEYAFFDGSDAAYRTAVHVGESVGPFKVTSITPEHVELDRDGHRVSMAVAQQLQRPPGGDWKVVAAPEPPPLVVAPPPPETTASNLPANAAEIVRRLMEQRQKQLKQ